MNRKLASIFIGKEKVVILSTEIDKKTKKRSYFINKIVNGEVQKEEKLIASFFFKKENTTYTRLLQSPAKTKFLLVSSVYDNSKNTDKNRTIKFSCKIFDEEFSLLEDKMINLNSNKYLGPIIDDEGNIFITSINHLNSKNNYPTESLDLYSYFFGENEMKKTNIKVGDDIWESDHNLLFNFTKNQEEIILSGVYRNTKKSNKDRVNGVFYNKVNKLSGDLKISKYEVISEEKGMEEYYLDRTIVKSGGGLLYLLEYRRVRSVNRDGYVENKYDYGNIIVVNMDNKGNVLWKREIEKKSKTNDIKMLLKYVTISSFYNYDSDILQILYNVDPKYTDGYDLPVDVSGKSAIKRVQIDSEGVMTEEIHLYDKSIKKIIVSHGEKLKISSDEYLIQGVFKNTYRLGIIKF
jgi:hypothetical protein